MPHKHNKKGEHNDLKKGETELLQQLRMNIVAELKAKGWSLRPIREEVMKRMGLETYSIRTTALDVKRVLKEWRDERLENTDDMVTEELAKIARTEREAWEAWEKSKVDHTRQRETMTGRATNGGKMSPVAGVKSEESVYACGDTRYLDIINKVSMERRKLLGLYAPEKQELTGKDGAPIVPQMTLDDAQKILSMAD